MRAAVLTVKFTCMATWVPYKTECVSIKCFDNKIIIHIALPMASNIASSYSYKLVTAYS